MWLLFCCIFQLKNPAICLKCCKKNFLIQNLMSIFAFWRLNSPFSLFEWHFIGPSSLILQTWNWHSAVDKDLAFPCTSPNLLYGKWLRTCWQRKIFQWPILHSGILYGKTGNDIGHRHVKSSIFVTQSRNKNCKVQSFLGCNYFFQCIQRRMTVFRPRDTLSTQSWRVNCGGKKLKTRNLYALLDADSSIFVKEQWNTCQIVGNFLSFNGTDGFFHVRLTVFELRHILGLHVGVKIARKNRSCQFQPPFWTC